MRTKITLLFSIVFLALFSCIQAPKKTKVDTHSTDEHQAHEKHWSYSGETSPEHWTEIEKDSDCDGSLQSPINIIHRSVDSVKGANNLKIQYTPSTLISDVHNNGHTIVFGFEPGDSINYKNETYYLKQIHFHEPSEHKINGVIYPIEIHLVHISKSGKLTVLGVLGEEGAESQLFEFFESFLPLANGDKKEIHKEVDLSNLFLDDKSYYSYSGSLTTPPCSEIVNWIVFKKPVILSVEEVLKLKSNMPINNYRNEQPLNGRIVSYHY
ncbi:carbonic anhydrase family protein [Tamlana fucoidanivorans]|uniref:Carbonic anhydrase n=1 Tax=Allotamlana fucoidanivorans TaxID=2583814 RepID=A0A5C4SEY7_9FLAO|nr:carbonic anhydrase family protein [Tamlana fucoidanivorans]TNJ42122.1 carbonic anhydrase family protein [Tamlana fucoidanivorans]